MAQDYVHPPTSAKAQAGGVSFGFRQRVKGREAAEEADKIVEANRPNR